MPVDCQELQGGDLRRRFFSLAAKMAALQNPGFASLMPSAPDFQWRERRWC